MFSVVVLFLATNVQTAFSQVTSVPEHLQDPTPNPLYKPKMIIFDTDHLLWPFWVDIKVTAPFIKKDGNKVVDQLGKVLTPYPDVPLILRKLKEANYTLAVASRADDSEATKDLLSKFDLKKYFNFVVIQAGSKRFHFDELKKKSGIRFRDMLFFDAEARNIIDTTRVGILSILVRFGMDLEVLDKGLGKYAEKKKREEEEEEEEAQV